MLKRFQAPYYDEGLDEIKIILPDSFNSLLYSDRAMQNMMIPHDNPHHTLPVSLHCREAYEYANYNKKYKDSDVILAALRHDIGKPYTKAFVDSKGNPCAVAHYYQHQCVGAWMSYGMGCSIEIAWLISVHMDPFLNTKYYNKLPAYLKERVDLLHEADLNAH